MSDSPISPAQPISHRARRWTIGCITVSIILFVALVIGGFWLFRFLRGVSQFGGLAEALPSEIAAAKRGGLPLTPDDLRPKHPIPDNKNAAPIYERITQEWTKLSKPDQEAPGNSLKSLTQTSRVETDRRHARDLLTRYGRWLQLAEKASQRPYCDFKRQWELGPDLPFPELAASRFIVRLLAMRAILESDRGNTRAAMQTLTFGGRIARHMSQDPTLIGMLVNIALRAILHRTFVQVALSHIDRPELSTMDGDFEAALGPLPDLANSLRGEVIMGRVCVQMIRDGRASKELLSSVNRLGDQGKTVMAVVTDGYDTRLLQFWRRAFAALRANRDNPRAAAAALDRLAEEESSHSSDPTYTLNAILVPVFAQAGQKIVHIDAESRLRRTLVLLINFRRRSGLWPNSLMEIRPAPPLDPFTGRPLIYRRTPDGFILYSVGEDLKDDGGRAVAPTKGGTKDIVIQYPLK